MNNKKTQAELSHLDNRQPLLLGVTLEMSRVVGVDARAILMGAYIPLGAYVIVGR